MRQFSFFEDMRIGHIMSLLMDMNNIVFSYREIIYKEGQEAKNMYFIKSGEVEIYKNILIQDDAYVIEMDNLTSFNQRKIDKLNVLKSRKAVICQLGSN